MAGSGAGRVHRIKVSLGHMKPPVWWRLLVPSDTPLARRRLGWEDRFVYRHDFGDDWWHDILWNPWTGPTRRCRTRSVADAARARRRTAAGPGGSMSWYVPSTTRRIPGTRGAARGWSESARSTPTRGASS